MEQQAEFVYMYCKSCIFGDMSLSTWGRIYRTSYLHFLSEETLVTKLFIEILDLHCHQHKHKEVNTQRHILTQWY